MKNIKIDKMKRKTGKLKNNDEDDLTSKLENMKLVHENVFQFFEQDRFNIISNGTVVGYCTNIAIVKDGTTLYVVDCGNKPGVDVKINEKNTIFSVSYTFDFTVLSNRKSLVICKTNDQSVAYAATLTKGYKKKNNEAYEGTWEIKKWEVSTDENTFVFLNNDTLTLTTTDNNNPILIYDKGKSTPRKIIIVEYYKRDLQHNFLKVEEGYFYKEIMSHSREKHPITRAKTYGNIVLFSLHNCFAYYNLKQGRAYAEVCLSWANYKIINNMLITQNGEFIYQTKIDNIENTLTIEKNDIDLDPEHENVKVIEFNEQKIARNCIYDSKLDGVSTIIGLGDKVEGYYTRAFIYDQEYIYYRSVKKEKSFMGFGGKKTTEYIRYNVMNNEASKIALGGNIFPLNGYSCVIGKGQIKSLDTLNKM